MSVKVNAVSTSTVSSAGTAASHAVESRPETRLPLSPAEQALWQRLSASEVAVLETPTDPHLTQYLDTVRDLLNQALKRHQAKSSTYWSPKGRFRQMVHIVEVNRALDDLLDDIRNQRPATQLAKRLDAIRGLLVDLWV